MIRRDLGDVIFLTTDEKYQAVADDIKECVTRGQPVLVAQLPLKILKRLSALLQQQALSMKFSCKTT